MTQDQTPKQEQEQEQEPKWKQEARRAAKERNFIGIYAPEKEDLPDIPDISDISEAKASTLIFARGVKIKNKETIKNYGERVTFLCKVSGITYKALAAHVGCTPQTITDITKGKPNSINPTFCNKIAEYFQCSAHFLVGYTDEISGVTMEGVTGYYPFTVMDNQPPIDIVQAGRWARIDPELFQLLEEAFRLDPVDRETIKNVIRAMIDADKYKKKH